MNVVQTVLTYTVFIPMLFCGGGGNMNTNTVELNTNLNVANANYIVQRIDGVWSAMGTGADDVVRDIVIDPTDGTVYACGEFTGLGGVANTKKIAKWDGTTWIALTDDLNGEAYCMAIAPNGDLWVGGAFTDIDGGGGGTYNKIARYDGSSWNAAGAGLDDNVLDIVIDSQGNIFACGDFTDVLGGGGGTYNRIAKWDGSAWSALGTGLDDQGEAMAVDASDNIYVVGEFDTADGVTVYRFTYWNGTTFVNMSGGMGDVPGSGHAVYIAPNGKVFVGGDGTTFGGVSTNRIAEWTGSTYLPLGGGLQNWPWVIIQDSDGIMYAGIQLLFGGSTDLVRQWDSVSWNFLPIDLPGIASIRALAIDINKLFLGGSFTGTATTSGVPVTTVTHAGPTRAFPSFTLTRDGGNTAILEGIRNLTTSKSLLFNHAMLDGERIVIDLTPGNKTIATYVGDSVNNALNDLLPGSDFGSFALAPGVNDIALYISETGGPTLTAFIQWQTTYPSINGVP